MVKLTMLWEQFIVYCTDSSIVFLPMWEELIWIVLEEEKQLNTGIWRQTGEWSCFRLTSSNHCLFCLYGDRGKRLSLVLDERVFQSVQTGANKVKAYYSAGCSFKRYTSMSLCHTASKMMQFRVHSKEHISSFRCGFYGVPNISSIHSSPGLTKQIRAAAKEGPFLLCWLWPLATGGQCVSEWWRPDCTQLRGQEMARKKAIRKTSEIERDLVSRVTPLLASIQGRKKEADLFLACPRGKAIKIILY